MGQLYRQALGIQSNSRTLFDDQRRWLALRDSRCRGTILDAIKSCVLEMTKARVAGLAAVVAANGAIPVSSRSTPLGVTAGNAARLSQSEIDALRAQIHACWNPPVGAENAQELIVRLRIQFRPDGTLSAEPELMNRGSSPYFRVATESAMRAVRRCQPYTMPSAKYDIWKDVEVTFDPRDAKAPPSPVISVEQQTINRAAWEAKEKRAAANRAREFAALAARNRAADPNSITVDPKHQQRIDDARALTAEQWAPYLQLITRIQIGIKCKVLDDLLSANVAATTIGNIMDKQQIQNGLIGDTTMVVQQEMAKATERGRLLVENKSDPGFCSRFFSDPADRARLRQIVNDLMR